MNRTRKGRTSVAVLGFALLAIGGCAASHHTAAETRTYYEGFVEIESISLVELSSRLALRGCHQLGYEGGSLSPCVYIEEDITQLQERGIKIFPLGAGGMGPGLHFCVTEHNIWAGKDLWGPPDPENFKAAVRLDVERIGGILKIKEDSWTISKMKDATCIRY